MEASYEVSHKLSRPADPQRICCAVSFSMTVIGPPQQEQSQTPGPEGLAAMGAAQFSAMLHTKVRMRHVVGWRGSRRSESAQSREATCGAGSGAETPLR